jgi:hypothetical protein
MEFLNLEPPEVLSAGNDGIGSKGGVGIRRGTQGRGRDSRGQLSLKQFFFFCRLRQAKKSCLIINGTAHRYAPESL